MTKSSAKIIRLLSGATLGVFAFGAMGLAVPMALAQQQEANIADTAETWRQIGALAFLDDTQQSLQAWTRVTDLAPDDATAWTQIGHLKRRLGDLPGAQAAYEKVLALGNQADDQVLIAVALGNLGLIEQTRGNLDGAEDYMKRSLAIHEALGSKDGMATILGNLGAIAEQRGDRARAIEYWRRAYGLYKEIGARPMQDQVSGWLRKAGIDPEAE